ncbi:hypothetical protein ZIOFF_009945 [Zingiber officinale]|uniref:Uncharacterized protein n=1 Tax=Zingiber officinale TaxID=94328 RepID=A0A8J5I4F6_ZINOF|nr:hypothetical protein ZIOFF_009945 [Zingiber officinale]
MDPSGASFWVDFLQGMLKPVAALSVVLMAVALSFAQKLKLEGEMIYAIARAFFQLSIIGFVLQFIFAQKNTAWIILAYLFMVLFFTRNKIEASIATGLLYTLLNLSCDFPAWVEIHFFLGSAKKNRGEEEETAE